MDKNEAYLFHQTPDELAKDLISSLDIEPDDVLYEPFRGEGAFYNHFPPANKKDWSEIVEGRDFKDYTGEYDWVITNPPYRLETGVKRVNSFWFILQYFLQRAKKGVAILSNDKCFSTLTPKRLSEMGWSIASITVCAVKKWRGRYFFIVFKKIQGDFFKHLIKNY
jgi:hypothetical protein